MCNNTGLHVSIVQKKTEFEVPWDSKFEVPWFCLHTRGRLKLENRCKMSHVTSMVNRPRDLRSSNQRHTSCLYFIGWTFYFLHYVVHTILCFRYYLNILFYETHLPYYLLYLENKFCFYILIQFISRTLLSKHYLVKQSFKIQSIRNFILFHNKYKYL